ncbi:MAG: putative nonstructural protein [hymenopteran phasma-related virus OKIAV250]|uniref:putative nonstructural protein n=1 Tax=hymenopteran phasma-related virus OKIAV250 TaxID=2847801 RepID=UPI0024837452|nr:MAG: putative nonstructural protein [hymenopteran phasma-related virus OKIAV250]WBM84627.1 MAG: putative nonstructural protein [hymenopteran phasma-related virus OKIAV250]
MYTFIICDKRSETILITRHNCIKTLNDLKIELIEGAISAIALKTPDILVVLLYSNFKVEDCQLTGSRLDKLLKLSNILKQLVDTSACDNILKKVQDGYI